MIRTLLIAARLRTLPAGVSPVILGLVLAYTTTSQIALLPALVTIICTILLQVSTNFINDYYDGIRGIDNDSRLGPQRFSSEKESANLIKKGFITTLTLSLLLGIYLMVYSGMPIIIIGGLSLLCAYLYTGGPYPISYYALGEVFAFIFFGPTAVWGTYYIQTRISIFESLDILLLGSIPGLISAAIMAINNLRDRESDSRTKKKTLATISGEKLARLYPVLFVLISTLIPFIYAITYDKSKLVMAPTILFYAFFNNWKSILTEPISPKFNSYLANTGKYLFIFTLLFCTSLLWK